MSDDKPKLSNSELFAFRVHHIIPISLFDAFGGLLAEAGIQQEARGNKIAVFFSEEYLQTVLSNEGVKAAYADAGFGFILHRGGHPGYTRFLNDQLSIIRERYTDNGVIREEFRAAAIAEVQALFAYAKAVSSGAYPGQNIDGSVSEVRAQLEARFVPVLAILRGETQVPGTPEQIADAQRLIDSLPGTVINGDLVDEDRTYNTQARLDAQRELTASLRAAGHMDPDEAQKANDRLDIAQGKIDSGDFRGAENDIRAAAIVNGKNATLAATGQLELTPNELIELSAAELSVGVATAVKNGDMPDTAPIDQQVAETQAAQERMRESFSLNLPDFLQLDEDTLRTLDAAIKKHVEPLGRGGLIGDTAEFLNATYDAFKIWLTTGDYGPLQTEIIKYGYAMVWSAALFAASIAVASAAAAAVFGAAAAPVAASIVAAGWAVYGLIDAYRNGSELFTKIANDIWAVIAEAYVAAETDSTNITVKALFDRIASDTFDAPVGQSFDLQLISDTVANGFANNIRGSDANELIWARNDGYIYGEGGNDELRYTGNSLGRPGGGLSGGAGNDVLLVRGHINIMADGGDGNDFIIAAASGTGGVFTGGIGRDVISVQSPGAQVYGDRIDGTVSYGPQGQPVRLDPTDTAHADVIYWARGVTLMDPTPVDQLRFYGYVLTGGNNALPIAAGGVGILSAFGGGLATVNSPIYYDFLLPFITYHYDRSERTMYVANLFNIFDALNGGSGENIGGERFRGAMALRNFDEPPATFWGLQLFALEGGDMGMVFKNTNPLLAFLALLPLPGIGGLTRALPMIDELLAMLAASARARQLLKWDDPADPIVLDLDGDGIETVSIDDTGDLHFDFDNDFFAERTGWLSGDDGFLTRDLDGDGLIEDVSELIGGQGRLGLDVLRELDANGDGVIDAQDAVWAELGIWQDRNQNGVTDAGELRSLDEVGILSINLDSAIDLNVTTPQGTDLLRTAQFSWADGTLGNLFEAIFEANVVDTEYRGKVAPSAWLDFDVLPDSRGFGRVTDLSVAMSNDPELAEIVARDSAAMTVPNIQVLRAQAVETLSRWSVVQELTRELTAVRIVTDAQGTVLAERAIWQPDADGGFYRLLSGAPVLDADGMPVARPTLDDVMAQPGWTLEQMFSPADQPELPDRPARPYLADVRGGDVRILDYGVLQPDGTWALASGTPVRGADGQIIAQPTLDDILAQGAPAGAEWRVEAFGVSPLADVTVERIGVYQIDGKAVDFTVEVTDRDGTFHVWARNLDRALELQEKFGEPRGFNLRNFEIDLDTLDEVNSTTDSTYRVEMMTPGQLNLAASLVSVEFDFSMLAARIDPGTGVISFTVNETGRASLSPNGDYVSPITPAIEMLEFAMNQYITFSQAVAVRMALSGGLSEFARGLDYDVVDDVWQATTDRGLAPVFEAIFEAAPSGYQAGFDYFTEWGRLLAQVYPDYRVSGEGNPFGLNVAMDQRLIMQYLLPAYEGIPTDVDLRAVMNAFAVDESLLVDHGTGASVVAGTTRTDFIHMTDGDQRYEGGRGADVYYVGAASGNDTINDVDFGEADELRLTALSSRDVIVIRDTQDLILQSVDGTTNIRVTNQFLGELNPSFGQRTQDTGVNAIVFSDGVMWDRFRIAFEVADPGDDDRTYQGSGAVDVLNGGRGNDVLRGDAGGDIYVFRRGDGQDVIDDGNAATILPSKAGLDMLRFEGDISAEDVRLERDGESDDLRMIILDKDGVPTGDTILIKGQFGGLRLNLGALGQFDPSLEIDYVAPNLIERFIFENGTSITFEDVVAQVLENARTDGEDAIFGTLADETLNGGAGNDILVGRAGGDTYVFGRGDGEDVIRDGDFSLKLLGAPDDIIRFQDDLRWSDFVYEREGPSDDLTMRVAGTGDAVIFTDFLESQPFVGYVNLIEQVIFADGTEWSWLKLLQTFVDVKKTAGDDLIYGFGVADILDGGAGDDRLEGLGGSDRYIYGQGYGSDVIFDAGGDFDQLILDGYALADIAVSRTTLDLIFTIRATGETITLENQFVRDGAQAFAVELFQFSDRAVNWTDLNPEDLDLVGTAGADTLIGSNFGEVLDGRGGDDLLMGGSDGDTYRWDAGYGNDVILDRQVAAFWEDRQGRKIAETPDVVAFGGGVTREELVFSKDGNDLVIGIVGRPDTLRIREQFGATTDGVELFRFFDGSVMTIADVEAVLAIEGGNRGDNLIEGLPDAPNTLDGRQGDDTLVGGASGDTYAFGVGYDFDEIRERNGGSAIDRVVFDALVDPDDLILRRDGNDLLIDLGAGVDVLRVVGGLATAQIERFEFANGVVLSTADMRARLLAGTSGNDSLQGFDGAADTLAGGAGNDFLEGGTGNDTYRFGLGDGNDAITETGGIDRLEFGPLITRDKVDWQIVGTTLVATLTDSGETLAIIGGASATAARIETVVFADGQTLTYEALRADLLARNDGLPGADVIRTADLPAGSDVAPGGGFDTVTVNHTTGTTRILFSEGDGIDVVDFMSGTGELVLLDHGSVDVDIRRAGVDSADLILAFPRTGDQIILPRGELRGTITFADGVVWTAADLRAAALRAQADAGNDILFGTALDDTLSGGRGDDEIAGGLGNDVYLFARGDGRDVITDTGGVDDIRITGYAPQDLVISRPVTAREEILLTFGTLGDSILLRGGIDSGNNINTITFSDGTVITRAELTARAVGLGSPLNDTITGTSVNETIEPGRGDDLVSAGGGSDTYIFRRGDGADVIVGSSGFARLVLPDHDPDDVTLVRFENRLLIRLPDGDEIMTTVNWSSNLSFRQVQSIEFRSGVIWNRDLIDANVERASTAQHNDLFVSFGVVDGGPGNDFLQGGSGTNTYVFDRGDGRDLVDDFNFSASSADVIELRGRTMAEARFDRLGDGDLRITFAGSTDEIVVRNALSIWSSVLDFGGGLRFDDGTLTMTSIAQGLMDRAQTAGADAITGSAAAETLDLGPGNDLINMGYGADVVTFGAGSGRDEMLMGDFDPADRVVIRDFAPEDMSVRRIPGTQNGLILDFAGSEDVLIVHPRADDEAPGILSLTFALNGTVLTAADLVALLPPDAGNTPTAGNDVLTGTSGTDVLAGGPGDDVIIPDGGQGDIILWNRGDGNDIIGHDTYTGADWVLDLGNVAAADVTIIGPVPFALNTPDDPGDLEIRIAGPGGGTIHVQEGLARLTSVVLEGGAILWNAAQIAAQTQPRPAPDGVAVLRTGTNGADTLDLTAVSENVDVLFEAGNDTYRIGRDSGQDSIREGSFTSSGTTDRVIFTEVASTEIRAMIAPRETQFDARQDLLLTWGSDSDHLVITEFFGFSGERTIEFFQFSDGVTLTQAEMRALAQSGSAALPLATGAVTLTRGDDTGLHLIQMATEDDALPDLFWGDMDVTLVDVLASEVSFQLAGRDILLRVAPRAADGSDALSLRLVALGQAFDAQIVLDDGTVFTRADILAQVLTPATAGDDLLFGLPSPASGEPIDITFEGGLGNDTIAHGADGATIIYTRGDGQDLIQASSDTGGNFFGDAFGPNVILRGIAFEDVTFVRAGQDLLIRIAESAPGAGDGGLLHVIDGWREERGGDFGDVTSIGVQGVLFEDEGLSLSGFDVLALAGSVGGTATAGDDYRAAENVGPITHEMLAGDDRVLSDGNIDTYVYRNGDGHDVYEDIGWNDPVEIEAEDGTWTFVPQPDVLSLADLTPDQVRFERRGDDLVVRIDADPATGTQAGSIVLRGSFLTGMPEGRNRLVETIAFADGQTLDTLQVMRDLIDAAATPGDDVIRGMDLTTFGDEGNETLRGGQGNDTVDGLAGADTYVYASGDGHDIVTLQNATLRLQGIAQDRLSLDASPHALRVAIAESAPGAGDAGSVTMVGALVALRGASSGAVQDLRIVLDGDVVLDAAQLATMVLAGQTTDGADQIEGSALGETLAGGRGDDLLRGDGGSDTYVYRNGDGRDIIEDRGFADPQDVLRLEGIDPGRVRVVRNIADSLDYDLVIAESVPGAGDGGRIILVDAASTWYGLEAVSFDDGTRWTRADLTAFVQAAVGATDGPDRLLGGPGNDTLTGGRGNDTLEGAGGNDVFLFARGDGADVIRDASGSNVLRISGYGADEITFRRQGRDGTDLIIDLAAPGDRITVADVLSSFAADAIIIELVDAGVSYTLTQVRAMILEGLASDGDDIVAGSSRAETLTGGRGNDLIDGQGGADTLIYRAGDGDDRFIAGADDVLRLPDLLAQDILFAARAGVGGNDLVLRMPGARDRVVVAGALSEGGLGRIEFADGTVWTLADMRAAVLRDADTVAPDVIRGFAGSDTLSGPQGDDTLEGGAGNDDYVIRRGDGSDVVVDTGGLDILRLPDFVSSEVAVTTLHTGSDAVVLTFASALGQTVTLVDALAGDARGVESIIFSDGVIWTKATLAALLDNTAPVARADGYFTATADDPLTIASADLLRNDFDPDGDPLRIIAVTAAAGGLAELDADGNVVFTADEGFTGPTRLTYVLSDGRGGQALGEVDLRVRPRAEARDDTGFTVEEDGFLTIRAERLLSNDLDGDRMVLGQVRDATGGSVSLASNGDITFTPLANFNGVAGFTYVANTPEGGRAEARVTISVTPVNDNPTARNDGAFVTDEDVGFQVFPSDLLGNDTDIDGDRLTLSSVTGSAGLTVELTDDGVILVTPAPSFFGTTTFTYTVTDGRGGQAVGTATVRVDPVNDAPLPQGDLFDTYQGQRLREDNPVVLDLADLLANDIELDGDPLTVVWVGNARNGTAELLDNGTILFTPRANFNGEARFDYRVDDGQGGLASATVRLDYQAVNDNPLARDDSYGNRPFLNGIEDQPIIIPITALMGNDTDLDGDPLTFRTVSDPENGDVEISADGLSVIFTPDPFFWGEARFFYTIADAQGAVAGAEVTMFFENVASAPPVANNDRIELFEDTVVTIPIATLLANDTDIDRDPITLLSVRYPSVFDGVGPINGTLAFDADGNIVFTPDLNADRSSGFFYTITDNVADENGVIGRDEGFVDIVIIPVNDEPEARDDDLGQTGFGLPVVVRIADLLMNDIDVDNDARDLVFAGIDGVTSGAARLYGDDFVVIDLAGGFTGPIRLDYLLSDGELVDQGSAQGIVAPVYDGTQIGGARRDLLIGNALDETLEGRGGNDDILAGDGADRVLGEDGRDLLDLGGGDDSAFGGAGDDTVIAGAGDDVIDGGAGADSINGGEGRDTIVFDGSTAGVRADLQARVGQGGFAQGDVYLGIEDVIGTQFADELGGDQGANLLQGLDGDDSLAGRDGIDTLEGGGGRDTLEGGARADILDGGAGRDVATYFAALEPGSQGVQIDLGAGTAAGGDAAGDVLISIEDLIGTQLDDTLIGDAGANALDGSRGDDLLEGRAGDDTLSGGRGADTLRGGDGIDMADYLLSAEGVAVDMSGLTAGGGDAQGDVFDSIEIVRGSFHDDTLTGNAADNILRGGRGADVLDGGAGRDIADYFDADEAVEVDLATGQGLAGEALGDSLTGIEALRGSVHDDTLRGGAGDDTFDGQRGADLMAGGAGSDIYVFGLDGGTDTVTEAGPAIDTDRVTLGAPLRPSDVSVVRDGDDMLLELERGDGFLIDTLRVTDHFLGRETGIEEVVFADGTVWDRDQMEALARLGRFNAADDIYLFGVEDETAIIQTADLLANDATEGTADLTLIAVEALGGTTATLNADGTISFTGLPNQNGDAFFRYTVEDAFGRQSTARVEVNLAPVNDAPTAGNDGVFFGIEDQVLSIPIAALLANDSDIDGDTPLRIVALDPLYDQDGNPLYSGGEYRLTNGKGDIGTTHIEFTPRPDHFGFAGFTYTLADPGGATTTGEVELSFAPVNDAPRSGLDGATVRLDTENILNISTFLANDFDLEDDAFSLQGVHSVTNGTLVFDSQTGEIRFTADALGEASFRYDLVDARGAEATITVRLTVIPLNDPPNARDDRGFTTLEDTVILIDPADLLANDSDPNGDLLVLSGLDRFPENGRVSLNDDGMIVFVPRADFNGDAGFRYQISDGRGGFDTAYVSISIMPRNDAPFVVDDVTFGIEDEPIVLVPGEIFGNDIEPDGDVIFYSSIQVVGIARDEWEDRDPVQLGLELAPDTLGDDVAVTAALADGTPLPAWLTFDAATFRFTGIMPPEDVDAGTVLDLTVTFAGTGATAGTSWTLPLTLDPAQAAALADGGVALDPDVLLLPVADTIVTAGLPGGRPLPAWLSFDAETRQLSMTQVAPEPGADVARVQITFTPPPEDPGQGRRASTDRAFTLEVVIDPATGVTPAVQALLAGDAFFAAQGFLSIATDGATGVTAAQENRDDLPDWMTFDPETLTFAGTAPDNVYVGAVAVRVDVAATADLPAFSILGDVVADASFAVDPAGAGFSATLDALAERVTIGRPEDFNGALVLIYRAVDDKGAVSAEPAYVVVNVLARPELPDAGTDSFALVQGGAVTFGLTDLLANDRDADGDPIRVLGVGQPDNGTLTIQLSTITLTAPEALAGLAGATFSAVLEDGAPLPDWLVLDAATGQITGQVPMDVAGALAIVLTADTGAGTVSATLRPVLDGNAGVSLTYVPDAGFTGRDSLDYVITDDAQGQASGLVRLDVTPQNRLPDAANDRFDGLEETVLRIAIADLLANDSDPDGDALRLVDFGAPTAGTLLRDGGDLVFTPDVNFAGRVTFGYTVTDDAAGTAQATVTVDVASTNRAPVAGADVFATAEDTPLTLQIADLLANDTDADPEDTVTFTGITAPDGARVFTLPGGRLQLVPEDNVNGTLVFAYTISDGRLTSTGSITLNVAPVNDAPIANPDGLFIGTEDVPLVIPFADLLANDVDVEGDGFRILEVFDGDNGIVVQDGQNAVFTGRADYFGNAGFSYRAIDDVGAVSRGFVSIRLEPADDRPIPAGDVLEMVEDGTLVIDPAVLIANDIDPDGDPIVFAGLTGAVAQADGTWLFTPAPDQNGTVTLTYRIDGGDGTTVPASLRIQIAPVPDAPTAGDDAFTGSEDMPLRFALSSVLANDTDPDGDAPLFTGFDVPEGVTVELDGFGFVIVTAGPDVSGSFDIGYGIDDTTGRTDTATIRVTFAPVNDAPEVAAQALAGTEDTAFAAVIPADAVRDIDGDRVTLSMRGAGGSDLPAWLSFDPATRTLSGQPPLNLAGVVALELVASDGQAQSVAPVTLTLAAVNDAPLAADDAVDGEARLTIEVPLADLLANDRDVDGDNLIVLSVGAVEGITARIEGDTLILDRAASLAGTFELPVTITDGIDVAQSVLRVTLRSANSAPVIELIPTQSTPEDTAFSLTLPAGTVTDADGDALTLTLARAGGTALPGWIAFDAATLTLSGTPPADFAGRIALELTASDGVAQAVRTFDLVIDPVNDAPVLQAPYSNRVTQEDAPVDIQLANLVTDPDGDALFWRLTAADGSALPGWLAFDPATLRLTGQPPADFAGDVALRLFASDGSTEISDDFVLTVAGRNDAPVVAVPLADRATDDAGAALTTGQPFVVTLPAGTFADVDGDALALTATLQGGAALPDWLAFEDGAFRGLAPRGAAGTLALAVTASDGQTSVTDVFTITLAARNAVPLVAGESFAITVPNVARLEVSALLANDIDTDGDTLSIVSVTSGPNGTARLQTDGTITYQADFDFEGEDIFTYTVSDGQGGLATAQVTVTVTNPFDGVFDGGNGSDIGIGGNGNDLIVGGGGRDILFGRGGNDYILGGSAGDLIFGGVGDDFVDGGAGSDTLFGDAGRDTLIGGAGNDLLFGGAGSDTFRFASGDGRDTIADFETPSARRRSFIEGDQIELRVTGIEEFQDLLNVATQTNGGVLFAFGNGDELFLAGTRLAALDADKFSFF